MSLDLLPAFAGTYWHNSAIGYSQTCPQVSLASSEEQVATLYSNYVHMEQCSVNHALFISSTFHAPTGILWALPVSQCDR